MSGICKLVSLPVLILLSLRLHHCLIFKTVESTLDNVYSFGIVQEQRHVFLYRLNASLFGNPHETSLRIQSTADQRILSECPLVISVRQRNSIVSWEVPVFKGLNRTIYGKVERTLCIESTDLNINRTFTIEVSTCSASQMQYTISASLRRDILIPVNQVVQTEISPTSPAVYRFIFPACDLEFAFIHLTSTSDACMIISIQQPHCPISDGINTIENGGHWQTVTLKTGISLKRKDFPNGFFIVFLLLPDDSRCKGLGEFKSSEVDLPRRKTVHFLVRDDLPTKQYHVALMIPLGLFLTYVTIIFIIHLHFHRIRCGLHELKKDMNLTISESSISTEDGSSTPSPTFEITVSRFGSRVYIADLMNSQPERLLEQSKRYYTAGLLVASFYCVPVFQLILSFHERLQETGKFDLCYFNYLCSHMFGMFHDFNHIYSNIGYVICGAVFVGIVLMRQLTLVTNLKNTEGQSIIDFKAGRLACFPKAPWDISKGVFFHNGLFYAMGFSLFMTGVMSAAYHICPNQNNFQFDTAFMYTIAALAIITIYQFRHPSYVSASFTFMALAIVAASTVLGLLWESTTFRIFFTVSHMTFLIVVLTYIYYVGYVRVNGTTVTDWRKVLQILRRKWKDDLRNCRLLQFQMETWTAPGDPNTLILPWHFSRLIFPVLAISVNTGVLLMIWTWMKDGNFASQVLAVYVINSSLYTLYYSFMKLVHRECREKLWLQPCIYLISSLCLWASSLSYFGDVVTSWEKTPAESRAQNAECIFLGFYDSHDVWHFISAAALFSSMMALLTMDDDLVTRLKSEIPVF